MNTRSSTGVEVVAADEIVSPHDMDTIISRSTGISSHGKYLLSRQQKCNVA